MERKIGKLGLNPIVADCYSHSGYPAEDKGTEFYIGDKLNLNIVYSVYHSPKTQEEIAQELGLTPVYIEDKIKFLEDNGFLIRTKGNRYTTYVYFSSPKYSLELTENYYKAQLELADVLIKEYVPLVKEAIKDMKSIYIPSGNYELFEASAIMYAISNKCTIQLERDLSKYYIKTAVGGKFIAYVTLKQEQSDSDYIPTVNMKDYWACGNMVRSSDKYPSVYSWSVDSDFSSRKGTWKNNITSDYEYLYEMITGLISENMANGDKFKRLRERQFITEDNKVNIMIVKENHQSFFDKIPELSKEIKDKFGAKALELAMMKAKSHPSRMQDLIISWGAGGFIDRTVGLMVLEKLYSSGSFKPLTENEKIALNLIMFSDTLPR